MFNLVESLEDRRLFAFGANGVASLRFRVADASEVVQVKQVLADTAGRSYVVAGTKTTFQVQRLTAAGTLDTSWGKKGSLLFVKSARAGGAAEAHVDASDRLVVLVDDKIVRLADDGRSDASFARGGVLQLTGFGGVNDFDVDANNKLYVTGSATVGSKNVDKQMRVERFISRGRLDRTFDGDGVLDVSFTRSTRGSRSGSSEGQFVRALPDGSVVVAGEEFTGTLSPRTFNASAVRAMKFSPAGTLDRTYGDRGIATYNEPAGNDLTSFSTRVQGIRATGQTVMYQTQSGRDAGDFDAKNLQLSADGQSTQSLVLLPDTGALYAVFDASYRNDDDTVQDLAVIDQRRIGILASDRVDSDFNGGQALTVGFGQTFATADVANAQATDGNILVAVNNHGGVAITVGRYDETGHVVTA